MALGQIPPAVTETAQEMTGEALLRLLLQAEQAGRWLAFRRNVAKTQLFLPSPAQAGLPLPPPLPPQKPHAQAQAGAPSEPQAPSEPEEGRVAAPRVLSAGRTAKKGELQAMQVRLNALRLIARLEHG